jgi:hypothetical protein
MDLMDQIALALDSQRPDRYRVPEGWAGFEEVAERTVWSLLDARPPPLLTLGVLAHEIGVIKLWETGSLLELGAPPVTPALRAGANHFDNFSCPCPVLSPDSALIQ